MPHKPGYLRVCGLKLPLVGVRPGREFNEGALSLYARLGYVDRQRVHFKQL